MQIDALTDVQLREVLPGSEDDPASSVSLPPPLPARRPAVAPPPSRPWLLLGLVVLAMAGLGALAGHALFGGTAPAATAPTAPTAPAEPTPARRVEIGEIAIGAPASASDPAPPPSVEAMGTPP
jgi:hypothetical protein